MKPTAQDVLDRFGFIPFLSYRDRQPGEVVTVEGYVLHGEKLVIIGVLTEPELSQVHQFWGLNFHPDCPYAYKAIAE